MSNTVLVLPRDSVRLAVPFTPAHEGSRDFEGIGTDYRWESRDEAEHSQTLIQPIPAAVLCDLAGNYLLLQRVSDARKSLRSRLSLVIGGHIEPMVGEKPQGAPDFERLLRATLVREVREELSLVLGTDAFDAVGIVVDHRGVDASRHVAFVYRARLHRAEDLAVAAYDEFAVDSVFSARMWPRKKLRRLIPSLDPWSSILVRSGAL